MNEFTLIHAVVDNQGKLIKLESESNNVLFAVTQQSFLELDTFTEQEIDRNITTKLIGVPSTTSVDLRWVKEKINQLVN